MAVKLRGRKLRSCDRCSKLKRACSSTQPCTACVSNQQSCVYSRYQNRQRRLLGCGNLKPGRDAFSVPDPVSDNPIQQSLAKQSDHDMISSAIEDTSMQPFQTLSYNSDFIMDPTQWNMSWALLKENTLSASFCHRPTQLNMDVLVQLPFLDNFTKVNGFIKSFNCGSVERRLSMTSLGRSSEVLSLMSKDSAVNWMDITEAVLVSPNSQFNTDPSVCTPIQQTHQIVAQIREFSLNTCRQTLIDVPWSSSLETICYEFFNPAGIQKYLTLFWSCWYPNWPTIHRPSFNAAQSSPKLVAAMAIVGACLSPDKRDNNTAKIWLNAVEGIVFSDKAFNEHELSDTWKPSSRMNDQHSHLEILQAAYCVCLYQTWEGCRKSKRRVLRQRFSEIVYASFISAFLFLYADRMTGCARYRIISSIFAKC